MILIPGIVYGYYAIFEMASYSLISFNNSHPIISFVGVSKSTYPLNWKLSSWNRHFIVVSKKKKDLVKFERIIFRHLHQKKPRKD